MEDQGRRGLGWNERRKKDEGEEVRKMKDSAKGERRKRGRREEGRRERRMKERKKDVRGKEEEGDGK